MLFRVFKLCLKFVQLFNFENKGEIYFYRTHYILEFYAQKTFFAFSQNSISIYTTKNFILLKVIKFNALKKQNI